MDTTINDAYATRDEKKIAGVLDAYRKAADAVIAAGPAKMVEVMDKAFTAAAFIPMHEWHTWSVQEKASCYLKER